VPVGDGHDREALALEADADRERVRLVVLDDQDPGLYRGCGALFRQRVNSSRSGRCSHVDRGIVDLAGDRSLSGK
jgi:hypothetical protein